MLLPYRILPALAAGILLSGWSPEASAQTFTVVTVSPGGGVLSSGIGINKSGQVAGAYDDGTRYRGYLWSSQTGPRDLGIFPGYPVGLDYLSFASDVNDSGLVVGSASTAAGPMHAFTWQNGVMTDLNTLGGPESTALAVNNAGAVVGYSDPSATGQPHAFLWQNGAMQDLGVLDSSAESWARDINSSRQVAVNSFLDASRSTQRAAIYSGAPLRELGTLPGAAQSEALAINDAGTVAGSSGANLTSAATAVLWPNGGTAVPLGMLPADTFSRATALNNVGQVVGTSGDASHSRAFLYENGVMIDLNSAIAPNTPAVITEGLGINDAGQIVGAAALNGIVRAVRLDPIYGDANGDFKVDNADVVAILKVAAGIATLSPSWIADVAPSPSASVRGFGDGRIDILDAVRTLREIHNKESHWP